MGYPSMTQKTDPTQPNNKQKKPSKGSFKLLFAISKKK